MLSFMFRRSRADTKNMGLRRLLGQYLDAHPYGLRPSSADQLRVAVSAWERFAGRQLFVRDLRAEELNRYLDWLKDNRAPDTFRTRRGNLLALWRFALQEGLTEAHYHRVRRQRPIRRAVEAWTRAEVLKLFETAEGLTGRWRGVDWSQAAWTASLFRAGYDTALRLGDLLAITRDQVSSDTISIPQSKTGSVVLVRLRSRTIAWIDQSIESHGQRLVWPLWGRREALYDHVNRVVRLAGIRPGTLKWLRRSAVTALEAEQPGMGTRLAGHLARSTTERHYMDVAQLRAPVLPPL